MWHKLQTLRLCHSSQDHCRCPGSFVLPSSLLDAGLTSARSGVEHEGTMPLGALLIKLLARIMAVSAAAQLAALLTSATLTCSIVIADFPFDR